MANEKSDKFYRIEFIELPTTATGRMVMGVVVQCEWCANTGLIFGRGVGIHICDRCKTEMEQFGEPKDEA